MLSQAPLYYLSWRHMADSFGSAVRLVRLHAPMVPYMLAREWVKGAYEEVCDMRAWSWLRAQGEFLINAQRSGTVSVVRASATVTGVGLTFVSGDLDRQFRVSSDQPPYTIIAVDTGANTIIIDGVYGGATASSTNGIVLDAYLNCPVDFRRFLVVTDPVNNWQLRLWVTQGELDRWDAQRSSTGTPWTIVNRRLATAGTYAGRVQYELWPYQTADHSYSFYYIRGPEALTDTTTFLGPLASNGNLLVDRALADAAAWPGLEGKKNPYFNPALAAYKKGEFQEQINRLEVVDEDVYNTWLITDPWMTMPFAPLDARFMQSHDATSYAQAWGGLLY